MFECVSSYALAFVLIAALESFCGFLWRKMTEKKSSRLQRLAIRERLVESRERQLQGDLQDLQRRQELFRREQMQAKVPIEENDIKNGYDGDDDGSSATGSTDRDSEKGFQTNDYYSEIDAGTSAPESTSASAPPSSPPELTSTSASASGGEQVGDEQEKDIAREQAFKVLKSLYRSYDALWRDISGAITGKTVQTSSPDTMRRFNDLTYWHANEVKFARDIAFLLGVIVEELDILRSEKLPVLCHQGRRGPCRN
ncbi:hypothetical protein BSKO_10413 [Bryopsis sp. KO-2023]|nr:hypothetical protein BSKO_10413 [Bryopsis sp. KO-2023]